MDTADSMSPRMPTFKSIDDPWIGLLVLAIFIFIIPIVAVLVFFFLWRRQQKLNSVQSGGFILGTKPTNKIQIPVQIHEQQPQLPFKKAYETQKMEVFVPSADDDRIRTRYPSVESIENIDRFYERTTRAYF